MSSDRELESDEGTEDVQDGTVLCRERRRHRSFTERRRNSQNLTPLMIPGGESRSFGFDRFPFPTRFGKKENTKEETKELFEHFVSDEIFKENLEWPDDLASSTLSGYSGISTPQGYKNPTWAKYGRELRIMADEFAETKERQRIKQRAGQVNMDTATYDSFSDMLKELFFGGTGGITSVSRERLVVLFFFCSDIVIRSLKAKATDLFKQFIEWSTRFITSKVAEWIENHGGWGSVLRTSGRLVTTVLLVSVCALALFGIGRIIMRRNSG